MKLVLALLCASAPAAARDVTGVFQTIYWPDSGVRTTVNTPPAGASLWAIARSGGAWQSYPGTIAADGSFVVPGVPDGAYYLALDQGAGLMLTEFTASAIDASKVVPFRPNLETIDSFLPVSLTLSGFDPWQPGPFLVGDLFQIDGSQSGADLRPFRNSGKPPCPAPGATSFSGDIDWDFFLGTFPRGLPDASQGDVTYFHTNTHSMIGSGAAALAMRQATHFSRRADVTISAGGGNTLDVALQPAPQTGRINADVRFSQFSQVVAQANPAAFATAFDVDVFGWPHTVSFPDVPTGGSAPVLIFFGQSFPGAFPADTDYGTLRYGEFLDSVWVKTRQTLAGYSVTFTAPGAAASADWGGLYAQVGLPETGKLARSPIAPRYAPVVPLIDGADGFAARQGVSLNPVISWKGRAGCDDEREQRGHAYGEERHDGREERGHAYGEERREDACGADATIVTVVQVAPDDEGNTNLTPVFAATVYGDSFTVPDGFLQPGATYFVDLQSLHGSWLRRDGPLFRAGPFEAVDTISAAFTTAGGAAE